MPRAKIAQSSSRPPLAWGATTAGQASAASARSSAASAAAGSSRSKTRTAASPPIPNGSSRRRSSEALEPAAEGAGEDVAGEAALGLAGDPAPHQLQGDDGDRLLEDQPLEVAEAAGVADDHDPGLRRAAAGRDHRVGERAAGDRRVGRDEGVPVAGVGERFVADRADRVGGELAAEAAPGEPLAAAVEDRDRAADRGGDRGDDLLEAALFEDQALEPALHRDPALQHLVLLVDEAGEGLLGDRDERRRVGDLEEREVALRRPRRPALSAVSCG